MVSFTFLFVGSLLCFNSGFGEASFSSSIAARVLNENLPFNFQSPIFQNDQISRNKREVITKKLEDPKGCISQCQKNAEEAFMISVMTVMGPLKGNASNGVNGTLSPEKKAAMRKATEEKTMETLGPMFADLCSITKRADQCTKQCPESQLRSIVPLMDKEVTESFCEIGNNFKEFITTSNCTKLNLESDENKCNDKCGIKQDIKSVTSLTRLGDFEPDFNATFGSKSIFNVESNSTPGSVSGSGSGFSLKYETDSKKNSAAVGPACKSVLCHTDCNKPVITEKCGAKAFEFYKLHSELEPRSSLGILKILGAVKPVDECKAFQ